MKTVTFDESKWKLVPIKPTVEMLEAGARHIPALHVWAGMLDAAPAPVSKPEQPSQDEADLCERIIHAVEGECDGLAITEEQASNILAYLQYGAPMRDMPEAFHIVDNAIGATENYEPEGGNLRIVTLRIDAARKVRAALASALQAEAAQEQVGKAEPIAWIRFCGDGLYEGPIMNCDRRKMDEIVRVKPDEWRALVLRNDSTQENGCLTRKSMQEKALEHGFEYWRAPDEHGITGTKPQCIEFLQDLLGVEVEIEDNGCQTCNGTGMIGGPSFYAPDEGGEPCPDCCDTPSYCSSVRRCTARDAEQPSERGEQEARTLFSALKSDEEKANFFLSGRGYETGVIDRSIQNDVAMAYQRCAGYAKERAAIERARTELNADASPSRECGEQGAALSDDATVLSRLAFVLETGSVYGIADDKAAIYAAALRRILAASAPTSDDKEWPYDEAFDEDRRRLCAAQPQATDPTLGEQDECTCGNGLGHARHCPAFDESMMHYEPFALPQPQAAEPKGLIEAIEALQCPETHSCSNPELFERGWEVGRGAALDVARAILAKGE